MRLQKAALFYRSKGYPVFPLRFKPENFKSPLNSWKQWQTEMPTEDQITQWWNQNPNANIGLAIPSGVLVLDADNQESCLWIEEHMPESNMISITGKGKHYFYKVSKDIPMKPLASRLDGEKAIDIRCNGSYVVAPPSFHYSNNIEYKISGDVFERDELVELKINDLESIEKHRGEFIERESSERGRNGINLKPSSKKENVYRQDNNLEEVFQELFNKSVKATYKSENEFSACCPAHADRSPSLFVKHDTTSGRIVFKCFGGCSHDQVADAYGLKESDLFKENKESYIDEYAVDILDEIDLSNFKLTIGEKEKKKFVAQDEIVPQYPEHLLNPPGKLGELKEYIESCCYKKQPIFALASSIMVYSTLLGQKIQSETGVRPNIFSIIVGESGCGKDKPLTIVDDILTEIHMHGLVAGKPASDVGVISALEDSPVKTFLIDEFGIFLKSLGAVNQSSPTALIKSIFMEAYSKSDSVLRGKAYANRKDRPEAIIDQPSLGLFGATTPAHMWSSVTGMDALDGFLNRCLIFESRITRPEKNRKCKNKLPNEIIENFMRIASMSVNSEKKDIVRKSQVVDPMIMRLTRDSDTLFEEFDEFVEDTMENHKTSQNDTLRAIWVRASEKAHKLAMVCAAADGKDEISLEYMRWGIDMAKANTQITEYDISKHVVESHLDEVVKKSVDILRKAGKTGMPRYMFRKKTIKWLKSIHEVDKLDQFLIETGQIVTDGNGKGAKYYFNNDGLFN